MCRGLSVDNVVERVQKTAVKRIGGVMMRSYRKILVVCGILIAGIAYPVIPVTVSHAAPPGTAQRTIAPEIKKEVEQKLRLLAKEVRRKTVLDKEASFQMLSDYLNNNPRIYGAALAFAPKKKGETLIKSSPYVHRNGEQLIRKDLIESYDYTGSDQKWYVVPVNRKKPVWSKPYFDRGGGDSWMVTYSIPIYTSGKRPRLIGVVTSDLLIPEK
jgi:hypothetical protein